MKRCAVCHGRPAREFEVSRLGEVTCAEHPVAVRCLFCTRPHPDREPAGWTPFRGALRRCPRCAVDAVHGQREAREVLPIVRREMTDIGIDLPRRVPVRVVAPEDLGGRGRAGTVLLGVTDEVVGPDGVAHVEGIRIAAGLPPEHFGQTVSHEMGHAWLVLQGRARLDPVIEEGICELFAYAWLGRRHGPLAAALRADVRDSPDPIYGDGFRLVHAAVRRHGIDEVVRTVLTKGELPRETVRPAKGGT